MTRQEQKTNWEGGKLYKAGKVGHIYRPKIIDSAGNWTWGILNIKNGILSVEILQKFLDDAVYPIRHAAGLTFGYTSNGGTGGTAPVNYAHGSYMNPTASASGAVDSVSVYGGSADASIKGFITDSSSVILTNGVSPAQVLDTDVLLPYSLNTINYSTKPTVISGYDYQVWIVW